MASRTRVVFDTNVLVSALLTDSLPRRAVLQVAVNGILLASHSTLAELEEVLFREKFARWLSFDVRRDILTRYREMVEVVPIVSSVRICRDLRDDKFLDLAVDGKASAIVTGDDDVLALDPFQGIRILTPGDFLALA
jgi:uncharacterized protein